MKTKIIHLIDLDGKDRYYFCIEKDNQVVQQEINHLEYHALKQAEDRHFQESVNRIKKKYEI